MSSTYRIKDPMDLAAKVGAHLDTYNKAIITGVKETSEKSMADLVKRSKAEAPTGRRKKHYKSFITSRTLSETATGKTMQWYVRDPEYRLTHLLDKGHRTRSGGQWPGTRFLTDAVDDVNKKYEKAVLAVIDKAGR